MINLLLYKGIISKSEVAEWIGCIESKPIFMHFMDEVWRILHPDGEFWISCPHGYSPGFLQDPTHCNEINETTFAYFDPSRSDGILWSIYRPKTWRIKNIRWSPETNIEVVMVKRDIDEQLSEGSNGTGANKQESGQPS